MEMFGNFVKQLFLMPMVFFGYEVTYGQFFVYLCLASLVVGFIRGVFR